MNIVKPTLAFARPAAKLGTEWGKNFTGAALGWALTEGSRAVIGRGLSATLGLATGKVMAAALTNPLAEFMMEATAMIICMKMFDLAHRHMPSVNRAVTTAFAATGLVLTPLAAAPVFTPGNVAMGTATPNAPLVTRDGHGTVFIPLDNRRKLV